MFFRRIALPAACCALFASSPAVACGFIESAGGVVTLRQDATTHFILLGRLENARGTEMDGSTDFVIARTLKADPALAGKTVVTIPRRLPMPDPKNQEYLVLGEAKGGKIDIVEGFPSSPALVAYVEGLLKIDAKDRVRLMRYAFDFLEHEDATISSDAFAVFITSADPDIHTAAKTLAPEKLRGWLRAKPASPARPRLYAYLLGNCGAPDDAALLRTLLDKYVESGEVGQLDGVFTGYTLLDPKAGWKYACDVMQREADFIPCYSALRAARYFRTTQPDVVAEADILRLVGHALAHHDLADIAIDYLREWKCWRLTETVLALASNPKDGFEVQVIQRSVVRYALQCPGAEAAKLVAEQRKANPARNSRRNVSRRKQNRRDREPSPAGGKIPRCHRSRRG